MRREALETIRCPACYGPLKVSRDNEADDIDGGELACGCGEAWVIRNSIPDLVFPKRLEGPDARSRGLWNRISRFYSFIRFATSVIRGTSSRNELKSLIDRLNLAPGRSVLELAAGSGYNLRAIAEQAPGPTTVFGLDISPRMLGLATKRLRTFARPPQLVLGNATRIPFADSSFDVVLDGFGIKYYADKSRAMAEMMRITKPGGHVVITELGLPPGEPRTFRQRLLAFWIPGFGEAPPVDMISDDARNCTVTWDQHRTAYVLEFWKPPE